MDEATSRTRSASRRMASAKPTATTRQAGTTKSPRKPDDAEISPARWAGVGLVIAAIIAAILLAMVSPSDPGVDEQPGGVTTDATPTPVASTLDTRLPLAQPRITDPLEGVTDEIEIPVTVHVPDEELPKRLLTLVVMSGDEEIGETDKPKDGGKVVVHVRLLTGANELTAALRGPGGLGPRSKPVLVTQDPDAPQLDITSPKNKSDTPERSVVVTGTSEVGAEVQVQNEANGVKQEMVVGNSGEFAFTVQLKRKANKIVVTSQDSAGQSQDDSIIVTRLDGRPTVKVKAPERVSKSSLPSKIRVVVDVTDAKGKKMEGAEVYYSLGGPGRTTITASEVTNAKGSSVWNPVLESSTSPAEAVELGVKVTSPMGDSRTERRLITLN